MGEPCAREAQGMIDDLDCCRGNQTCSPHRKSALYPCRLNSLPDRLARLIRYRRGFCDGLVLRRHLSHAQEVEALGELALQTGGTENGQDHGNGRPLPASKCECELSLIGGYADAAVIRTDDFAEIVVGHGGGFLIQRSPDHFSIFVIRAELQTSKRMP